MEIQHQHFSENQDEYIPGVCNIGKEEVERRKRAAIISLALCVLFIICMVWFEVAHTWRLFLFIPAASFGVGFQQWYYKFCAGFGLKGVFNFEGIGKTFAVEQKENLRKDFIKARRMFVKGILFGLLSALIFYLSPF